MKKLNKVISFFKSNYTKEEVLQLDKKELKQIAKQKGFAIGTVLIAIALIAAVGAAIAIASKSTSKASSEPQSKLYASNVISQGSSIKQAVDLIKINNGVSDVLGSFVFNPYANGLETGEGGNLTSGGLGKYGIFNPRLGTNFVQLDNKTFATTLVPTIRLDADAKGIALAVNSPFGLGTAGFVPAQGYNNWFLGRIVSDTGTNAADDTIFLTGIKPEICIEINKTVNGTTGMDTTTIPSVVTTAGSNVVPWNATAITNKATVIATGGNASNVDGWNEGCFYDSTNTAYVYFNVLDVK